jgi:drug/metabolite transporter (DMT)-like permease
MPEEPIHAVAWAAGAALFFALMSTFVKLAMPTIPYFELIFIRSIINLLIVLPFVQIDIQMFKQKEAKVLLVRGLGGLISLVCLFYSIEHLPLAIASLLSHCSPIFVVLFSRIFIRESLSYRSIFWISGAVIGVLLLAKGESSIRVPVSYWGLAVGLFGAACAGLAMVAIRAASAKFSAPTIIFCFVGVSAIISAPLALANLKIPNFHEAIFLLGMGVCASIAQYMMTHAYQLARAGLVSAVGLSSPAYAVFLGWMIFGETLAINQWFGIGIIGVAITLLAWEHSH